MILKIDFDGTCVSHMFPKIGKNIGAAPVLRALTGQGHKLILWTVRSDMKNPVPDPERPEIYPKGGPYLTEAKGWFERNKIQLWGINENPTQYRWTKSPKAYADMIIDDSAAGCPLFQFEGEKRPFVNWWGMTEILIKKGILDPGQCPDLVSQLADDCEFNFSTTKFSFI